MRLDCAKSLLPSASYCAALLAPEDMKEVTDKMDYYDPFIMEDPHFGALIRVAAAKEAQNMVKNSNLALLLDPLKQTLLRIIEARFPDLDVKEIALPDSSVVLEQLIVEIATAYSEGTARSLLKLAVQE